MSSLPAAVALVVVLTLGAPARAQDAAAPTDRVPAAPTAAPTAAPAAPPAAPSGADAAAIAAQRPTYPLGSCIACGEIWGAEVTPLDVLHKGRLIRVCNAECGKAFEASAVKLLKVLDDAIIAAQSATYPLQVCVISGEPLGKAKYAVAGTRLIKVCCGDCKQEVSGDPDAAAAALAQIDAAFIAAQSKSYPLTTCVVDDAPLGETPVRKLHGVTLVQVCGEACAAKFEAAPKDFLAQLDAARKAPAGAKSGGVTAPAK